MTQPPKLKMIAIDDDATNLELIHAALRSLPLAISTYSDPAQGLAQVLKEHPQMVLLDLMMPGLSGLQVLEKIMESDPSIETIFMSGNYSTEAAVEAIQKGAADYLTKPIDLPSLRERIQRLIDEYSNRRDYAELDRLLVNTYQFEGIIGRSPMMLDLYVKIRRVAPHFQTVLISGPTGSGKELVAQALHRLSPVSAGTFAVCNCSAIVETLVESELFGYVKGSFTGATSDKIGLFEYANNGTLFLDEIGELPLAAQAKLLRVLQNHEVQRVGSPIVRKINTKVVAATHRNLKSMVAEGKFREDLYYRLSMVDLPIPPLHERLEDLPLLTRHFLERFSRQFEKPINGITRRAQSVLASYSWPGNVRELEHVLGNALMMTSGSFIDVHDLPESVRQHRDSAEGTIHLVESDTTKSGAQPFLTLEEVQLQHIEFVMNAVQGNKARAADILGISRGTLYNLIARKKGTDDL